MRDSLEIGGEPPEVEVDILNTRRIRHITSIQVRNLTPFPVRDAFASALKQPSEQPQFTPHGHLSDDLDVTIGRKRARRFSSTSSITLGGSRFDGDTRSESDHSGELGIRRRTSSRASGPIASSPGVYSPPSSGRRFSTAGTASMARPSHRQRTISVASSSAPPYSDLDESNTLSSTMFNNLLTDTSQRELEKILQSRLVETFLTITLPIPPPTVDPSTYNGESLSDATIPETQSPRSVTPNDAKLPTRERSTASAQKSESGSKATAKRNFATASATKANSSRPTTPSRLNSPPTSPRSPQLTRHTKTPSAPQVNGKTLRSPASPPAYRQRSPTPSLLNLPPLSPLPKASQLSTASSSTSGASTTLLDQVPDYISPIHRPSTNPTFQLDAGSGGEFATGVDLTGSRMRIEVWGHVKRGLGWASKGNADTKGKGKEKESDEEGLEWRALKSWNVDVKDLVPLPAELVSHPAHLPSNTLMVHLSPPGRTFYLPVSSPDLHSPQRVNSASGYSSDPESEVGKVRSAGELIPAQSIRWSGGGSRDQSAAGDPSQKEDYGLAMRKGKRRTASWQDLLRLINLQACIVDTQRSLNDVVREIDKVVTQPGPCILRREVSEREAWAEQLRDDTSVVVAESEKLRSRITQRKEDLWRRREILALALEANEADFRREAELEEGLVDERQRIDSLRSQIGPMRSVLITTLAFIFPIELVSSPDLLFTILDVPLPIPLAQTDPAPPLSLPTHKEVNEESVATALGYSAQVVQLLTAYMGKSLVYPITCVGSRSLIKDGISAMVGPRMFPLFSKGVDTYRFEYGVFLLNKDIELLMSDRNLRALDMRHTLPNLKNLLLTLTGNEGTQRPPQRFSMASSVSISSLQSPILTASTLPSPSTVVTTPTATHPDGLPADASHEPTSERDSPPQSGATTPTASAPDNAASRKSRAFLDLSPFTGFLRVRYPSSSRPSVLPVLESPEGAAEQAESEGAASANGEAQQGSSTADEEDDRRTIRGRPDRSETEEEGKVDAHPVANGHAAVGAKSAGEKAYEEGVCDHPPQSPGVFVGGVD